MAEAQPQDLQTQLQKLKKQVDELAKFYDKFADWSIGLEKIWQILQGYKVDVNAWLISWPGNKVKIKVVLPMGLEIEVAIISADEKISYEEIYAKIKEAIINNLDLILANFIDSVKAYNEKILEDVRNCLNAVSVSDEEDP